MITPLPRTIHPSPYTPLFRSGLVDAGIAAVGDDGLGILQLALGIPHAPRIPDHGRHGGIDDDIAGHVQIGDADRKSTRLNSSHVAISYAVLCMKTNSIKLSSI